MNIVLYINSGSTVKGKLFLSSRHIVIASNIVVVYGIMAHSKEDHAPKWRWVFRYLIRQMIDPWQYYCVVTLCVLHAFKVKDVNMLVHQNCT